MPFRVVRIDADMHVPNRVTGELSLGNLRQRDPILALLRKLPRAIVASDDEVLHFIKRHALFGLGVGYVDVHLLASARLTPGASLWTRDNRLLAVATRQALAANVAH
jgi:hypothetical protein